MSSFFARAGHRERFEDSKATVEILRPPDWFVRDRRPSGGAVDLALLIEVGRALQNRVRSFGRAASSCRASRGSRRGTAWLAACLLAFAMSCAGKPPPRASAPLPTYTPEDAALFNDLFRPELFGFPGILPPEADQLLDERVTHASSVVPAKIVTVTLEGDGERKNYSVVAQPAEPPLAGRPLTDSVTLTVAANSPVFGWVEGAARGFVGTRLMLFVRIYEDGPHFHGSVDTLAVRQAIARARIVERRRP